MPFRTSLPAFVIFACAPFVIAGCGAKTPDAAAPAAQAAPSIDERLVSTPYVDRARGFSIHAPAGWQVEDGASLGVHVVMKAREQILSSYGPFLPNMNVVSEPVRGMGLDKFVDYSLVNLKKGFTGFKIVNERYIQTQTHKGRLLEAEFESNGYKLQLIQLFVVHKGTGFVVTGTVPVDNWLQFESLFEATMASFSAL
ncbi:MAG: hypothetical protein GMKNLPBB_00690 [Myxococcota bacterium]|nr:hypothetical protein [Myxococcota bacterium]